MNFDESVNYLYELGNEVLAMKLGLENIGIVLAALGNPQKKFLKVQIAGTNGKGSTCAFLEAICLSAQIKTGLFTSPHLISITERIKINGVEISRTDFARYATKVRTVSEELVKEGRLETVPTYFEQVTAISLIAFAGAAIELAILETGLGGRFDATTAAHAEIVAITSIDYDHQNILGDTLSKIAAEKAAIIREDTTVVVAPQKLEALKVILPRCDEMRVSPVIGSCAVFEENVPEVSFKTKHEQYPNITLGLQGDHQRENACTAINLAEILSNDFNLKISKNNIIEGLETARHKGRLEWQVIEDVRFLFDGAHNAAGANALRKYLQKYQPASDITFVFGAMRDKDLSEIAKIIFPLAENLILTTPDNPRSEQVEKLSEYASKLIDKSQIFSIPNVSEALEKAIQTTAYSAKAKSTFVCITGSLYLVGEAQEILRKGF